MMSRDRWLRRAIVVLSMSAALPFTGSAALAQTADPSKTGDAAALEVRLPAFPNATCPIMGKAVSSKLFVDTEKGRIYMCCKSCTKKIRSNVSLAHQTAYPVVKAIDLSKCPISGKPIPPDGPTVTIQGYTIPVCCPDCIKTVQATAQVVLAKAIDPKISDLGNTVCPITNEPVAPNAFCLIGETLVHLSSPACVVEVKKDPARTLEKARSLKGAGDARKPGR